MPLYTKESLEKLRERIDLVEVLSSHVDMKKNGAAYKGLCPFHEEKTPSFMIQKGDTHYHCFGCGAHGDAIQFLMNYSRLSFGEAVESLAEKFGVPLVLTSHREERGIDKASLREALETASSFFHTILMHTEEGREALTYLEGRGLSLAFLNRFEVGLAPQTPGLFRKVMEARKIPEEVLMQAGLLGKESKQDFFRDRITFPIRNATGSVIGFSARKYKEKTYGGKYINTPETPLFKKSRTLFGLNYSREKIAKERKAIIVEGQIDCLKLIEAGFNYTVASLGTAFGEEHVKDLHNLGLLQALMIFDGDEAGITATAKVGNLFQKIGIEARVVRLPEGQDPDSFLTHFGVEKLTQEVNKSIDYLTFQVERLSKQFDMRIPAQKAELVRTVEKEIREWEDPVMVHESLRSLAKLTHVPEETLNVGVAPPTPHYQRRPSLVMQNEIDTDRVLELDLLRWLILAGEEKPTIVSIVATHLFPEHFSTPLCKRIYESYMEAYRENKQRDLLTILIDLEDEEGMLMMDEIVNKKINLERAEMHTLQTVQKLLDRKWLKEREEVKKEIDQGQKSEEELLLLLKRFDRLNSARPKVV